MIIEDMLRIVDELYPNSYSVIDKIGWINELNQTLALNYNQKYASIDLKIENGVVHLPQDITYEQIYSIWLDGKEVEKQDYTRFGISYLNDKSFLVNSTCKDGYLQLRYLKNAKHIRYIDTDAAAEFTHNSMTVPNMAVEKYDTLTVTVNDTDITVYVLDMEYQYDEEIKIKIITNDNTFADTTPKTVHIKRELTDETVAPAPYDMIYAYFIASQIAFWQHNTNLYNHYITMYNTKLSEYMQFVTERQPQTAKTRDWKL